METRNFGRTDVRAFDEWIAAQNAAMRVQIALTAALQLEGTPACELQSLLQELKEARACIDAIVEQEIGRRRSEIKHL